MILPGIAAPTSETAASEASVCRRSMESLLNTCGYRNLLNHRIAGCLVSVQLSLPALFNQPQLTQFSKAFVAFAAAR